MDSAQMRIRRHVRQTRNGSFVASSSRQFKDMVLVSMISDGQGEPQEDARSCMASTTNLGQTSKEQLPSAFNQTGNMMDSFGVGTAQDDTGTLNQLLSKPVVSGRQPKSRPQSFNAWLNTQSRRVQ